MHYLRADNQSATGYRVALSPEALPQGTEAEPFLSHFNGADGFSVSTPWLTIFPESHLDARTLPSLDDLEASLLPDSAVQVFDRETGERYPVWAEVDQLDEAANQQTLVIRPMKALPFGRRIAVVVTDSLRNLDGTIPLPPIPFAALRGKVMTTNADIEGQREQYERLFEFLGQQGIQRQRAVMAWEAVTFSEEFLLDQLRPMVEQAQAAVAQQTPAYRIVGCRSTLEADIALGCELVSTGDDWSPLAWRHLKGLVELPSFIDDAGQVVLDGEGRPLIQGREWTDFSVNIPLSLQERPAGSAPLVLFGHGLLTHPDRYLADADDSEGQMSLANDMGAVFVGIPWRGLSAADIMNAVDSINNFGGSFRLSAELRQGMINQLLMPRFGLELLAQDPLLQSADGTGTLLGSGLFYKGISQGGSFGVTFMALSPDVETAVLHVPGGGYAHMLPHSADFTFFASVLAERYPDRRDQQLFFGLVQRIFDPVDGINYVQYLKEHPLTDRGPKNCLLQCAVGDSESMWYACDMLARSGNVPAMAWGGEVPAGLQVITGPTATETTAVQYFDPQLGLPQLETGNVEPTGAHRALRRHEWVQQQTAVYFDRKVPGRVVNPCEGPCLLPPR
jgi:hypothetical protein